MELIKTKKELNKILPVIANGKTIGLVPTMGALHKGHLSLIEKANTQVEIIVVSIFVNPTQFNNPEDLKKYPRDLESDIIILKNNKCDIIFAPDVKELYPEPDTRNFHFGYLEETMEGKHRPGHFNGVAQIVSILFDIVNPHKAYFGLKDFQQVAIIKNLIKKLNLQIELVSCPTIREADGLAMSSRNLRLTVEERNNASIIYKTLVQSKNFNYNFTVQGLKDWVVNTINNNKYLTVEYFEIVNDVNLKPVSDWNEENNKVGCIAVFCGKIRLIDNITYN